MLSRGVLLVVQLVVGLMATPRLLEALPPFGGLSIFAYAVLAGLVVWVPVEQRSATRALSDDLNPLLGALLGYAPKR